MIKTFEASSIHECAKQATEWHENEGHTEKIESTQIHVVKGLSHTYVMVLTCNDWYHYAKYGAK